MWFILKEEINITLSMVIIINNEMVINCNVYSWVELLLSFIQFIWKFDFKPLFFMEVWLIDFTEN